MAVPKMRMRRRAFALAAGTVAATMLGAVGLAQVASAGGWC